LLRQLTARAKTEELVSTYFDTAKTKLRKRGVSLRIRRMGDRHIQTIKRDRADDRAALSRDEWECGSRNCAGAALDQKNAALLEADL
jgi:triphosphatase